MCISVKTIQRTKFDVSQKPLMEKMHTEPEILNWMIGGVILYADLHLYDSPDSPTSTVASEQLLVSTVCTQSVATSLSYSCSYGELWAMRNVYSAQTREKRATYNLDSFVQVHVAD